MFHRLLPTRQWTPNSARHIGIFLGICQTLVVLHAELTFNASDYDVVAPIVGTVDTSV